MPNHLTNSLSPYLLQHAHNPVDWYPWGEEALEKARSEEKPIFLSIGYAACHWCHVMAHESFEDPAVAAVMNQNFINIKVDREERPDLDSIYMTAVVALTGQGGWPMSVFLTPDLTPFYAGTYFPPISKFGLPSLKDVLLSLSDYWLNKRAEVLQTGIQISAHIQENKPANDIFEADMLITAGQNLVKSYDWQFGGWGSAPKFPQPMALEFLLQRHLCGDSEALKPVMHALSAMARGGMYDVLGGGFARYSTDNDWHIPHFEKMLYDNAQLVLVYLHAWQITQNPNFRRVVDETLAFISWEMTSPEGGFYSSLDADSEGEEGKFYTWSMPQIRGALGGKDELFEAAYGLQADGQQIVLRRALDNAELAKRFKQTEEKLQRQLQLSHAKLLETRSTRIRPATDDKVLTSWNGLMLAAFAEAARVFDNSSYLRIAQKNADFLLTSLQPDGNLRHSWRNGHTNHDVFLEDYASLILGLLVLYQSDFDNRWFREACILTDEMIRLFLDPAGGFFDTTRDAMVVLSRPKVLQDNATPSGNALAMEALLKMAALHENEEWQKHAGNMADLVAGNAAAYPTAFSRWLSAAQLAYQKTIQAAIIGDLTDIRTGEFLAEIRGNYRANMVVAASNYPPAKDAPKLLSGRSMIDNQPTVYVCEGFVCQQPVTTLVELKNQLGNK